MDHHGQRIDALAVDEKVELDDIGGAKFEELVIHRRITARYRLQLVEEIHHHFRERQLVGQHHLAAEVLHVLLHAALVGAQRQHRANVFLGQQNRCRDDRLPDFLDP